MEDGSQFNEHDVLLEAALVNFIGQKTGFIEPPIFVSLFINTLSSDMSFCK
ncbi:hypothetical protein CIPAW_12G063000 [Carya illinoinensis]|uniref:Uncharacterized protein n=1 Tax=Carya illinoinensis TaxID=32201 RepID=A0A8T1NPW1_CARIL|nr:hypothetical protein CIPAW_12G063000 [Carya illinoinensis]